jgi:malate dehydrogenase
MHISFIGVGRIGQTIAYSSIMNGLADSVTLYDIVNELPQMFEEELRHAMASVHIKTEILSTTKLEDVANSDIVVITAGKPRKAGMSRRDLAIENAKVMRDLAIELSKRNKGAKYIIVTNPVDLMASIFYKFSREPFVISTGDQVETMRMRSFIAKKLKISVNDVEGFVGGEHGEDAVVLWSTVKINNIPFDEYLKAKNIMLSHQEVEKYVKDIAAEIIRVMGGTTWGPGTIIKDVIKAVAINEDRIMSVAIPQKYEDEIIHVSIPTRIGKSIGPSFEESLTVEEKESIKKARVDMYNLLKSTLSSI